VTKLVNSCLILVVSVLFLLTYVSFCDFLQLFERTPVERLGYKEGTNPNIRDHKFFERINWKNLEERKVTPPFKPSVVSDRTDLPSNSHINGTLALSSQVPPLILSFNNCLSRNS